MKLLLYILFIFCGSISNTSVVFLSLLQPLCLFSLLVSLFWLYLSFWATLLFLRMSSQIHNGHNITLAPHWGTLVIYQKCSCCFSLSKELTFALTWTHASAVTNRVTEKRISLIRHGFDWGLRLEAPCCCHEGSGSVTAVQCFGCDSYTGKINTGFSRV